MPATRRTRAEARMLPMDSFLLFDFFFWTYGALLVGAALFDAGRFIIPNWISLALVGLFALAVLAHPMPIDWLSHLGAMALVLVAMLVIYRFGVIGGGDLKLMTAVSLWVGFDALPQLILWVGLAGGAFRSEEHTSELQSLMRTSYAVFC